MEDRNIQAGSKIKDRIAFFASGSDLLIDRLSFWKMKSTYN